MIKNKITEEQRLNRIKELSGIKPINENDKGTSTTLFDVIKARGVNYVIVREASHYFIKSTTSDLINESTLGYIDGLANKNEHKYRSYADALKQLNLMKLNLQESLDVYEKLEKDIDPVGGNEPQMGGGMPQGGLPPQEPAPVPMPEPQPEAPTSVEPQGEVQPQPMAEPEPEPSAEDMEGLGDDDLNEDQIDHYVGKLTGELRKTPEEELSGDRVKGILNSVLSALPLDKIDPDDRLKIAIRIKKGLSKKEDNPEDSQVQPESPAPQSEPTPETQPEEEPIQEEVCDKEQGDFDKKDDKTIKEFLSKNEDKLVYESNTLKTKNILVESVDNKIVLSNDKKRYEYNVSESTLNYYNKIKDNKITQILNEEISSFFNKKTI